MKLIPISDTHNLTPELPDGDLLCHSGDLTIWGSLEEFEKACEWLSRIRKNYTHGIVFTPGNHDMGLDSDFIEKKYDSWNKDPFHSHMPRLKRDAPQKIREMLEQAGVTVLVEESVEIAGFKIYGTPYTPLFGDYAFSEIEGQLPLRWAKIPHDTNLLLSHGPPAYILDKTRFGMPVGSQSLAYAVKERPSIAYHQFGHIHPAGGDQVVWGKLLVNATHTRGEWQGFYPTRIIETDDWSVSYSTLEYSWPSRNQEQD